MGEFESMWTAISWKELKKGNWVRFWYPEQPLSATMEEWADFEKQQRLRPIAFFFAEQLPDFFRKTFIWPVTRAKDNLRNKLFNKPVIHIRSLENGWHDTDTKMLHGNFQLLVDFVEKECAWMQIYCHGELKRPNYFVRKLTDWRNTTYGTAYLSWWTTLDDPKLSEYERSDAQAANGREILDLYHWWKHTRTARPEPMEASGWSARCDAKRAETGSLWLSLGAEKTPEERAETTRILDSMHKMEEQYDQEDEAMLIRLIKVRHAMWT